MRIERTGLVWTPTSALGTLEGRAEGAFAVPVVPHSQILRLHAAAVAVGLTSSRNELLAGIPQSLVAAFPSAANASAQILSDLDRLNDLGPLADGALPLRRWLENALALCGLQAEAAVFREVLVLATGPGPSTTPLTPGGAASAPVAMGGSTYNIQIHNSTIGGFGAGTGVQVSGLVNVGPNISPNPGASDPPAAATTAFGASPPTAEPAALKLRDVWDLLDGDLQRAFALAYNDARLRRSETITTQRLFAALRRLRPEPLGALLDRLPQGSLPAPIAPSVPAIYDEGIWTIKLVDKIRRSLHLLRASCSPESRIAPLDLFVDIAKRYSTGTPGKLRDHGIGAGEIDAMLEAIGGEATPASVYLSYGDEDLPFARRLFEALEAAEVPVFFREEHDKPGVKQHRVARQGIYEYDHVLLICSKRSLDDPTVLAELENMLGREHREGGAERIIPIWLDRYVVEGWKPPHSDVVHAVTDRTPLRMEGVEHDEAKFTKGIDRLIRALKG